MNLKKFPPLLALTIGLELILAPLPVHADANAVLNTIGNGLNLGNNIYQSTQGGPIGSNSQYVQSDMQAFTRQQTAVPDKYFTLGNMQKIPGLMDYINSKNLEALKTGGKQINPMSLNCTTLPTSLSEPNNEVCRNERVNGLSGDPGIQAQEAFLYYNQFLQTEKIYQNFSVRSNVGGQAYGIGCMEDAMEILKGFFAYRADQLDTVVAELEASYAKLEALSQADLTAIRETTAILNGENSKFAGEFKNSDIFNYADKISDPACSSMYSKTDLDRQGKEEGGLLAIERKLKEDFNTTPPGSKYSAEAYLRNSADIVTDIEKMADKVATQANLNFRDFSGPQSGGYSNFLNQLSSSVNSDTGIHASLNASLFSNLQTKFAQSQKNLTAQVDVIRSELGGRGANVINMLNDVDNDSSFDAAVTGLQNEIKSECLNRSGVDEALSKIFDPNLSKQANKHTADQMRKRTKAILADTQLSPERKVAELKALELSVGGRYHMRMDADYEIKEVKADGTLATKRVKASGKVTPTSYFTDVINNCESQFQVNKLNNQLSAKEAFKQLRTLKKDYQQAARTHASDIKNEIVKQMVNCNGNAAVANSVTVGSCSPAKLDMSAAGFCAKGAQSCATNMKQCSEKVAAVTKKLKDDRFVRTNNYNNNVEATRKDLVSILDRAMASYMKDAEGLRSMFGVGFKAPKGIERDVKGDRLFDQDFLANGADNLQIKDPKVYIDMMKENLAKLSASVEEQQNQIIGNDGALAKHIAQTGKNYEKNVIAKIQPLMRACLNAYKSYGKMVEDMKMASDKAQGELGEKSGDFCNHYEDIMVSHVTAGCDDALGDVSKSMINAAMKAGNTSTAMEAKKMRQEMQRYCKQYGNQRDSKTGKSTITFEDVCAQADLKDPIAVEVLKNAAKTAGDNVCSKVQEGDDPKYCKPGAEILKDGEGTGRFNNEDCSKTEKLVVAAYNAKVGAKQSGLGEYSDNDDVDPPSSVATASFCGGSNNANGVTKGNSPSNPGTTPAARSSRVGTF